MSICFDTLAPKSEKGFGLLQKTYAGGRVGVSVNHFGGLNQIVYWGALPDASPVSFFKGDPTSSYVRLFRAQLVVDGAPYNLEFAQTSHFPFGYRSRFDIEELGVSVLHRLTLVNDALLFSMEVLRNDRNLALRQRFEHHAYTADGGNSGVRRTFSPWEEIPGGWALAVHDWVSDERWSEMQEQALHPSGVGYRCLDIGAREARIRIGLLGDLGLMKRETFSRRGYFTGGEFTGGSHACALLFADDACFPAKAEALLATLPAEAARKEAAFERGLTEAPGARTGGKVFDSMLANIPLYLDALMLGDLPGGMRASSLHYGVWGWDTMMSSDAYLLAGRHDFVRDALRFYRDTAHPVMGVAHKFTRECKAAIPQAPSAQYLYLIFLYQYLNFTGNDAALAEFYPFAKLVFQRGLESIGERGLGTGPALYPDEPHLTGHTGHDSSVFNNSLLYQGARCMEWIASRADDEAAALSARQLSRRLEERFVPAFWDEAKGYFVDSIDSRTGEQRPSYPAHALLWQTPFLNDLAGEKLPACGEFIARNHATPRGFLIYPRWDPSFDGDGNQMAQIWSTSDVFDTRCEAAAGRQDILGTWVKSCEAYWNELTLIEGYSAQTVNDSGTLDAPGGIQPFGAKSIYMAFVTNSLGLHFDRGGLTVSEGIERAVEMERLRFRGSRVRMRAEGKGKFPSRLTVNGAEVKGSRKIPASLLAPETEIVLVRTVEPPPRPCILWFCGGEVDEVSADASGLHAALNGVTEAWLHFYSPSEPAITLDGRDASFRYDAASGEGRVLIGLAPGVRLQLHIAPRI